MTKIRLLVLGAGGHGRSVAEAAVLSGKYHIVGFLDDDVNSGESVLGFSCLGKLSSISSIYTDTDQAIVAIGNNSLRERFIKQLIALGVELATVVHPQAIVSPSAVLGVGSTVMAGSIIGTEARLGLGTIVNCGAVVDHNTILEDFGHLGVNACMAGGTVLDRSEFLPAGNALVFGVSSKAGI